MKKILLMFYGPLKASSPLVSFLVIPLSWQFCLGVMLSCLARLSDDGKKRLLKKVLAFFIMKEMSDYLRSGDGFLAIGGQHGAND